VFSWTDKVNLREEERWRRMKIKVLGQSLSSGLLNYSASSIVGRKR
jgi:hypothetical protein